MTDPHNPCSPEDSKRRLSLRIVTQPKETNHYGTIFGGVILSYIDQAGFVEATRHGDHKWVTVAVDKVIFKKPVGVGDIVSLHTRTVRCGTTSVTVSVEVEVERHGSGEVVPVTEATLTLVAVDAAGKPVSFGKKP